MSTGISAADLDAARRLLGLSGAKNTLRNWQVDKYTVEQRIDTAHGGLYLYCPCASWRFGGKARAERGEPARSCKHTQFVEAQETLKKFAEAKRARTL